jgi:predicted homoserine dehydrogenase-like protein
MAPIPVPSFEVRQMNYHRYFGRSERAVETCLVGTGHFGRSYLRQALKSKLLQCRVAVDIDTTTAAQAWQAAGIAPSDIALCETAAEARLAWDSGRTIVAGNLATVIELPIGVLVEATGHPEAGAMHAGMAIEAGWHVALVSKEVDIVIGAGLAKLAQQRGRVVTPIDGDQPSLLMGLVTWAEVLGLEVVAAGKSSEYDFVFDPATGNVTSNGNVHHLPKLADAWALGERDIAELIATRADIAAVLQQRTVPDLCELLIAANAVNLSPDRPDLHAPILRINEVATAFSTKADGGVLGGGRRIDVFNCLRHPDEVSFAGGVFIVVRCEDAASWRILGDKGHILSRNERTALVYQPRHLLGIEAATSILEAGLLGVSSGAESPEPRFDLAIRADADLGPGTILAAEGHHHAIANCSGHAVPGGPLADDAPVPYYLAANRRLTRPVAKGALIRCGDVEIAEDSHLARLRRKQDALFFGK